MLGEWYLPPGACQVILPIKEGTISISHPARVSSQTRISQTSSPLADKPHTPEATRVAGQEVWAYARGVWPAKCRGESLSGDHGRLRATPVPR